VSSQDLVELLVCPESRQDVHRAAGPTLLRTDEAVSYPVVDGVPVLIAGGAEAVEPSFRADRLARLAAIEEEHFWFGPRLALVERLLDRHPPPPGALVLDLGCGTGALLEPLRRRGYRPLGLDVRPEGLASVRARDPDAWLVQAEADRLPLRDGSVDAVVALDVLEHVDDGRVLAEVARVLRPGGLLVASVPAYRWLWSRRDEDAGHLRRYGRRELERALADAGLAPAEVLRYQCLLFPLVAVSRLVGRRGTTVRDLEDAPPRLANRALGAVNRFEVRLGRHVRFPFGSSLVVAAEKPA
jgi:SAM-dependent methyltransferase